MRTWEPVEVKQIVGCTCDVCKKSYRKDEDVVEFQEMVHISFTGGYGSIFGDMDQFELDICQHCLKEKLGEHIRTVKNWLSPQSQLELSGRDQGEAYYWGTEPQPVGPDPE